MKKTLFSLIGLSFILLIIMACWFWYAIQVHLDTALHIKDGENIHYQIKIGMNLKGISYDLAQKEILDQPYYLILAGRLKGYDSRIKAGEYLITSGTTSRQLLKQFISGQVVQHSLTLVEGWTYKQVMNAIYNNEILLKTLLPDVDSSTVMQLLGYPEIPAEGYFFPDTYYFPAGTTDLQFLSRAYMTMIGVLETAWQGREVDLPYNTPQEALIMASIIEKETAVAEERPTIASVFVSRLRKGMKLQSDPTVIYAMGDTYSGNIRRKDLKIDSPYNTYFYKGLPPIPIALAGTEAINAALHPAAGDMLYFVAKGNGMHYFSKTLKEHNRAVKKYQLSK